MVLRLVSSMVMAAAGLSACLDHGNHGVQGTTESVDGDGDPQSGGSVEPDRPDSDDPTPDEPTTGDPGVEGEPQGGEPPTASTWCLPTAAAWQPSVGPPEVPMEALDPVCALEREATLVSHTGFERVVRYTWQDEVLWVEEPLKLIQLIFDGAGNRVEASLGTQRPGELAFAAWDDVRRFRWDADGNLTESAIVRGDAERVIMKQRFADGRLVERTEERNRYAPSLNELVPSIVQIRWDYDEVGRLVDIAAESRGHSWTARWSYDDAGRPAVVERSRDGQAVDRMTWSYDTDGALIARTVMRDPSAIHEDGFDPALLDSFGVRHASARDWLADPWFDSLPRVAESGCTHLPTSDFHGYPGDAVEYELGTPRDERPVGIGFAYGANTYGWNYGDLSWYSHAGVHGFDGNFGLWGSFSNEIRYAAGRMVEERLTSDSGPILGFERLRTFDDGNLVLDRLDLLVQPYAAHDQPTPDPRSFGRELRFTWDVKGEPRLTERQLHDDEVGLVEWQSWSRDLEGRWLSHSIISLDGSFSRAAISFYAGGEGSDCEDCEPTNLRLSTLYSRTLDDAGRTIERRISQPDDQGILRTVGVETWRYDAAGRVVEAQQNDTYLRSYAYDEAGRLVYESWDYDGQGGEADGWILTTYDERGRWTERETWSGGALHHRETRTFACH